LAIEATLAAGSAPLFDGRGDAVGLLRRRLEDAGGGVTVLVGEHGVGKSTLIFEVLREARGLGLRVLMGRAGALDDPPPYSLLQSAIESAHDDGAPRSGEDPPFVGDELLLGFGSRLGATALPTPAGSEARLGELLGGSGGRGTMSRDRVLAGIAERLLEFTRRGPTVLLLDDLHRADESSRLAVEYFASELKDQPLWILATSRPHASLSGPGRERLEQFERTTGAQRILLPALTPSEAAVFLRRENRSRPLSPQEVAQLYSDTGGNPLLLRQLGRRAPSGSEIRGPSGTGGSPPNEAEQPTLDLAAVLGPEFPFDVLLRASGGDRERLRGIVERLVDRGVFVELPGAILTFSNDRLRKKTYGRLTEERRRLLHRQVGDAWEAMGSPNIERTFTLARHYFLGREARKSIQYNRLAGELAARALALETAWVHFSRALESQRELSPSDPGAESEIVLELAAVKEEHGLLPEAEGILRDFLRRENDDSRLSPFYRATLEMYLARVLIDEGDMPAAKALAEKVLGSPGLEDHPFVLVGAHHQLGQALYYGGQYPEALAQHTEEIRLAQAAGNEVVIARAQAWRVAALQMMGEMQQAIAEARALTAARDRFGSLRESAQAHLFFGDILADARSTPSQREEAVAVYREAMQFGEKANDPRRVAWALYKTAELVRETAGKARDLSGRTALLDEATEKIERALGLFRTIGDRIGLSVSLKVRGQIAIDHGTFEPAQADLLEARRLLHGLHHSLEEIDVILRLGQLSLARGDRAGAREFVAELERQNLPVARADLEPEFAHLRQALGLRDAASRDRGPGRILARHDRRKCPFPAAWLD
jgi:predicted ATPase